MRVDLVSEMLRPAVRRVADILGYAIFFCPFVWVFTTESWEFAMRSFAQGEKTYGAVQLPVYPVKIAMAVAAGLLLVQGVCEVLKLVLTSREHADVG